VAYGITPLLDRGINGRGETVVLPELAESHLNPPDVTDMRQDMAAFDSLFHLPAARMRVVTTLAGAGSPWLAFGEEALDVEMVHALAPGATLVILLLPSTSLDNTKNAVAAAVASLRLGSTEGGVMSISAAGQIGGEHCVSRAQAESVNAALQAAASRHVTVVAASGDIGAVAEPCDVYGALTGTGTFTPVKEVNLLASDPLVLGVGGTSLTAGAIWASSTRPSTRSRVALSTTGPSTTSPRETTPCSSRPRRSPATRRHPAGIRSAAGAVPTRRPSSRCSPATRRLNSRAAPTSRFLEKVPPWGRGGLNIIACGYASNQCRCEITAVF
jgi:subtilase family serine protease